jgi:DNA topoisomerase-1
LESDFEQLVDLGFTASMEQDLDLIASGSVDWREYLERFYCGEGGLASMVEAAQSSVDPRAASTVRLGEVEVRIGRYGPFLEARRNGDRITASVPEDLAPGDLTADVAAALLERGLAGPESLGTDPVSGRPVLLREGPFGPYVQLGEAGDEKPKRVSLPPGLEPSEVNLPAALGLLALPRDLGPHPLTGKPVRAGIGRFGPYVVHDGLFASLKKTDNVLSVGLDRALELLAQKAAGGARGGARRPSAAVLRTIGTHPETGEPVELLDGKYGPYVRHGKTNASLPNGLAPEVVDLERALALLAAKKAKKPGKRRSGGAA